jgi:outer membrane protein OmpA-like peptidoglycan-associated protein/tetratricopeptide (TPR) repeat protein
MRLFLFLLLFIASFGTTAQSQVPTFTTKKTATGKGKTNYDEGVKAFFANDYEKALKALNRALKEIPDFIDAEIYKARTLNVLNRKEDANESYKNALRLSETYEPQLLFSLATQYLEADNYEEATLYLTKYLATNPSNEELKKKAMLARANSVFAANAVKNPVPFQPKPLEAAINSVNAREYFPMLTADGKTLIFTQNPYQEDFYTSEYLNGAWLPAKPILDLNTPTNEGAMTITADGKTMICTYCELKENIGSCDLYYTRQKEGHWQKPINLGATINSALWDSQPNLSSDGNTLLWASRRANGLGGSDIWMSKRSAKGDWMPPQNLGSSINTPYDEATPFLCPDGQTLFFTSQGHPGMGGFDLFRSKKKADGTWEMPQNLGFPINTKENQTGLFITLDGKTAYFASDKTENHKEDIFTFELPVALRPTPATYVKGKVYDASTNKNLIVTAEIIDLQTGTLFSSIKTDELGEFLLCLPIGRNYALNINKEKYAFYSENFALSEGYNLEKPFVLDVPLQLIPLASTPALNTTSSPIPTVGKPIILKNIFFETGSAILKNESQTELNRLKNLLNDNPTLRIQLNGHTDNVGAAEANQTLSLQRAKAVYDFLIKNGIAAQRLTYKGFGQTQPIDTNASPEGRQNNRRTEFVIL